MVSKQQTFTKETGSVRHLSLCLYVSLQTAWSFSCCLVLGAVISICGVSSHQRCKPICWQCTPQEQRQTGFQHHNPVDSSIVLCKKHHMAIGAYCWCFISFLQTLTYNTLQHHSFKSIRQNNYVTTRHHWVADLLTKHAKLNVYGHSQMSSYTSCCLTTLHLDPYFTL